METEKLIMTKHFKKRMREREISKSLIDMCLRKGYIQNVEDISIVKYRINEMTPTAWNKDVKQYFAKVTQSIVVIKSQNVLISTYMQNDGEKKSFFVQQKSLNGDTSNSKSISEPIITNLCHLCKPQREKNLYRKINSILTKYI